jgi:murein DD-endopeptidase MepM/ murein hydrolase activator NlpD
LDQESTGANRLLDRLANIGKTSSDPPGAASADPLAGLWDAVARLADRGGLDRLVPICICALLVLAAFFSSLPDVPAASAAGGSSSRLDLGAAPLVGYGEGDGPLASDVSDIYLGDGSIPNTLQNPGVGTDARSLLRTYTVVAGDTLGKIAARFGLATATIYWANKAQLPDPGSLRVGQQLLIPPMDGLLVTVGAKDTLESLAAKYKVAVQDIVDANNLPEATLTIGQTLIIPGVSGGPVPASKTASGRRGWYWPVSGRSYISQYFWSGHHAIDIAADYGTAVVAAASGVVVAAGWRSVEGGGNVIWIMHGSKLYSTYNHLSAWSVRAGQKVGAGQTIGRVGTSGVTTGPHLHFEVWLGYPWALGNNSDAVNPCIYLAGC